MEKGGDKIPKPLDIVARLAKFRQVKGEEAFQAKVQEYVDAIGRKEKPTAVSMGLISQANQNARTAKAAANRARMASKKAPAGATPPAAAPKKKAMTKKRSPAKKAAAAAAAPALPNEAPAAAPAPAPKARSPRRATARAANLGGFKARATQKIREIRADLNALESMIRRADRPEGRSNNGARANRGNSP